MTTPTDLKVPLTPITIGEAGIPIVANRQPAELEANIDNIIAYLDGNSVSAFDWDEVATTGISFAYKSGRFRKGHSSVLIITGTTDLTGGDVLHYIFVDQTTDAIINNTTGFPIGSIPLYEISVSGGVISVVTDVRAYFNTYQASTLPVDDSGLSFVADNVQTAIDEIDTVIVANTGDISNLQTNKLDIAGHTISRVMVTDGSGNITTSAITTTKLDYLGDVTSLIQAQLNSKEPTITGAATTITGADLTANRVVISSGVGKISISTVTTTELGWLTGVSSNIQTQLNGKSSVSHNHDSTYLRLSGGSQSVSATTIFTSDNLYVGTDGGGDSDMYFYADFSNTWRTLRWDNSSNEFQVEDSGSNMRTLIHSGNIDTYVSIPAVGSVGSYALLMNFEVGDYTVSAGSTMAGSRLRYWGASADDFGTVDSNGYGTTPSGTWRVMGRVRTYGNRFGSTLFLRIS